jgi:RNA polymerase sigma factor (sigma-70 family)
VPIPLDHTWGTGRQPPSVAGYTMSSRFPREVLGMPPPALAALLAAEPSDQAATWADFLEAYTGFLVATAYRSGRSYDGALDGYAFILDQLKRDNYRRLREFRAEGMNRFSTWLGVVARRLCLDHARRRYGRRRTTAAFETRRGAATGAARRRLVDLVAERIDVSYLVDEAQQDAETQLEAAELTCLLNAAVDGLAARSRLLLKLRFERGLPAREIASLMGFRSEFDVYRALKPVLVMLRRELRRTGLKGSDV